MDKVLNLIKQKTYTIPGILFLNYKDLNITSDEFIVLIYLINENDNILNYQSISDNLKLDLKDVLTIVNTLNEKDLITIELNKVNGRSMEFYNLENLYKKLAFLVVKEKEVKEEGTDLFPIFEKEFGRTLTPMDYEIISAWQESDFSDEVILLALKEAVYNGVPNLRYIDKILYDWKRKGIKNKADVEKDRANFQKKTASKNLELFDYDWLNDTRDS